MLSKLCCDPCAQVDGLSEGTRRRVYRDDYDRDVAESRHAMRLPLEGVPVSVGPVCDRCNHWFHAGDMVWFVSFESRLVADELQETPGGGAPAQAEPAGGRRG